MLRHKQIDRICCIVLAATLLLTCGFMSAAANGLIRGERTAGYEMRLFDQSRVHTLDIVMDDWEEFIDSCTNEEYAACTVVIDGEKYANVAIRAKGNTSLSQVASYGNDRYSFKIEFDHYQTGMSYHGLDKLSLNNLIQDKTYMKDYLAYTLMGKMGVAAPLCSFVQIRVNGEEWGVYLAVEAVEDSFLTRNYGVDHGELYKPDSLSFGGGRGNGRDFNMDEFREQWNSKMESAESDAQDAQQESTGSTRIERGNFGGAQAFGGGFDPSQMFGGNTEGAQAFGGGFDPSRMFGGNTDGAQAFGGNFDPSQMFGEDGSFEMPDMGGFGGMGSSDVRLQYIDDDPDSYSNIFSSAKTDVSDADKARLIESLKVLSEGENIESAADVEAVIRYLVVHNFLVNDDSYTGTMVHNYYLYEEDGRLSMLPWDYNLAIGAFSMGGSFGGGSGATSAVNSPIDSPVSSGDISSRPMVSWIFESEEYTALYHEIYNEFITGLFDSGWVDGEIVRVKEMLAPYVETDATAFFTAEEFLTANESLREFCTLRAESISGQLDGSIPSTTEGQRADSTALVDASHVALDDMGEFGMGGGRGGMPDMGGSGNMPFGNMPGGRGEMPDMGGFGNMPSNGSMPGGSSTRSKGAMMGMDNTEGVITLSGSGNMPGGFGGGMPDMGNMPGRGEMPDMSGFGNMPGGGMPDMGGFGNMPGGMDQMTPPDGFTMATSSTSAQEEQPADESGSAAQEAQGAADGSASQDSAASRMPGSRSGMGGGMDFSRTEFQTSGAGSGVSSDQLIMLAVCAASLLAAVIFARFYRSGR